MNMENNYKSLFEATVNYAIETNKQAYDFGTKMVRDYAEFSKDAMKLMPGMDAWTQLIPASNKK